LGFKTHLETGRQILRCRFDGVTVRPQQRLGLILWLESGGCPLDYIPEAGFLDVVDGHNTPWLSTDKHQGILVFPSRWEQCGR
jgi:hypothetical protein